MKKQYADVELTLEGGVALVEIQRPPHNFFDTELIESIATAFEDMDDNPDCRALVLAAQGKSFCAGANLPDNADRILPTDTAVKENPLYSAAVRLFDTAKPIIGAIQGAAIGGGLGLSLVPDFRVCSPQARFCANFAKLGFHPGFALTYTLPKLIGPQKAALMMLTGRRISGQQAVDWGLADVLANSEDLREKAMELAHEIAENAPLTLLSIRASQRQGLVERIKEQTDEEFTLQTAQRKTGDFKEGIRAVTERRPGIFTGK